jgi:23S rRNA (cytidine2498-2'-O)-methyltransferase
VPPFGELRLEVADTNEGKEVSSITRALAAPLASVLHERGILAERAASEAPRTHVLFADGAHVYVGASVAPWSSRWPMGIPRLALPRGAPSRSTLKLAEAFVTFLGEREPELVRAGMRAVDLGAAPGGWSWQLAHRGLRVTAVDNGPLKGEVADHPLVTHLPQDGLTYRPRRPVDWMVCDIALSPSRIAALVARWIADGDARRSIFNLKLPMKKRYAETLACREIVESRLREAGVAYRLSLRQLYHDREEVTGFVERSEGRSRRGRR